KVRLQDEAIAEAKLTIEDKAIPFGRFVETIRDRAGLTRIAIGERIEKTEEYVQRLERGDMDPVKIAAQDFADIVELFHLRLDTVAAMIVASPQTAQTKTNYRAAARSHGGI